MRRLIINADDLGISDQRSHGIFLCAEHGVVTSASLIVNMPASDAAARRAHERGLPTGLHLNLTEGSPLSKTSDIKSLLTVDGYFLGRDALRRELSEGTVIREHIEREARAQIEWFLEHRGQPTHVDGHHCMHIFPSVAQILAPMLDKYSVAYTVIPSEPGKPFGYEIDPKRSQVIEAISTKAEAARKFFTAHGIGSTDHFRGLALSGCASMRNLRHILSRLPEGTTELMMHPGSPASEGDAFELDPQRQTELNMLLNDDARAEIVSREIILCSYADLY